MTENGYILKHMFP